MRLATKKLMITTMALGLVAVGQSQALQVEGTNGTLTVTNNLRPVQLELLSQSGSISTTGSTTNAVSPFQISLNYVNGAPGGSTQAAFENAKATWESLITGWKENFPNSSVVINVDLKNIDGAGGVLGSAGPTNGFSLPTYFYTSQGDMTFDTSDIGTTLSAAAFENVVEHEMGHVLGIGTLWSASFATGGAIAFGDNQELYVNNSGQYTGALGLAAYNAEFDQAGAFVPVELGGGGGTANGHWNEVDGGGSLTGITSNITGDDFRNELMTGWLNAPTFISSLTIDSMQDLGYDVVPEPSSIALLCLGGLFVARRRRRP